MRVGIYGEIRRKASRAIRNGTGFTFSNDEVLAILHSDIWMVLMRAEMDEMRAANPIVEEGQDG